MEGADCYVTHKQLENYFVKLENIGLLFIKLSGITLLRNLKAKNFLHIQKL